MTIIERSIVIPAPAAIVWATLTDTGRYGSWNPFIPELTGELRPDAKIRVRISPPGGRAMSFTPTVTAVDEGRRLEWLGHLGVPGLFDGRHSFTLEPVEPTARDSRRRSASPAAWSPSPRDSCDVRRPASRR